MHSQAELGNKSEVEEYAQSVLDARQPHLDNGATLADLYARLYMPAPLLKAHQYLDRAVDRCYRRVKFQTKRERLELLFGLHEGLTGGNETRPQPEIFGAERRGPHSQAELNDAWEREIIVWHGY
ncbi:MAG: hypothetical protein JNK74_06105 [Candidatus Hydrogenedentes bacterium]|nr:hypothetical protein [Candidatus Hydrogenedentota bacterium]